MAQTQAQILRALQLEAPIDWLPPEGKVSCTPHSCQPSPACGSALTHRDIVHYCDWQPRESFHKQSLASRRDSRDEIGKVGTQGIGRPLGGGVEETPKTLSRLEWCQPQWLNGQLGAGNTGIGRPASAGQGGKKWLAARIAAVDKPVMAVQGELHHMLPTCRQPSPQVWHLLLSSLYSPQGDLDTYLYKRLSTSNGINLSDSRSPNIWY